MGKKINLFLLTIFFVLFSLSTLVLAVDCPVPDTGQTKCYDNDSEITCPQPGEPFYGQDAQHPCNPQSYTTLSGGIMVQDNVTGLVWENKTDDGSIHDKDNIYIWDDVQSVFIATLNSQNFGGYSDWRLPTIKELYTLVDSSMYLPSINTTYFPNTVSSYYWSSTTYASSPGSAWLVLFGGGGVVNDVFKSEHDGYVRAVRGGQCGSLDNFIDNRNSTVTNTDTGLMWELKTDDGGNRDKDNVYTWEEALSYCENLDLAGYDDWRLPNINELQSLVDYTKHSPSINTTFFSDTQSSSYWSSTTYALFPNSAWGVYFGDGGVNPYDKSYNGYYVRAVRGGQCGSLDTSTTTTAASTTTTISGSTTSTIQGSTTTTTIQPCPTEQLYGEYSEETETLRYFRDNIMSQTPEGQEIIMLYYKLSPVIVKAMKENEEFKKQMKEIIDGVLELIRDGVN